MSGAPDPIVSPQWTQVDVAGLRGTVLLLGASDSGKSVLGRYLYGELCRAGVRAAYLDADMGQSTLGLPTTMTVALAGRPGDDRFPPRGPRAAYFVGSTTPRGFMLPAVVGAFRLREKALALGAETVIVDTTGLVAASEGGRALKQWKIELLAPEVVIALARDRELEPIVWPLRRSGRVRLVEWRASAHAVPRPREARIARRRELMSRYLHGAGSLPLPLRRLAVYELERLAPGAVLAFQDGEGWCLGLGVVEQADRREGTAVARTPLGSLDGVAGLRPGALHWDLAGGREV